MHAMRFLEWSHKNSGALRREKVVSIIGIYPIHPYTYPIIINHIKPQISWLRSQILGPQKIPNFGPYWWNPWLSWISMKTPQSPMVCHIYHHFHYKNCIQTSNFLWWTPPCLSIFQTQTSGQDPIFSWWTVSHNIRRGQNLETRWLGNNHPLNVGYQGLSWFWPITIYPIFPIYTIYIYLFIYIYLYLGKL